jgi:hypothetical protein
VTEEKIHNPGEETGPEEEPQVFAVHYEAGKMSFSRKEFLELAAAASVAAAALSCQVGGTGSVKKDPSPMPRLFDTLAPTLTKQSGGGQTNDQTDGQPSDTPRPSDTPETEETDTPEPTKTPKPTNTPQVTPTQAVSARVKGSNVNLRSGPATYYDKVGVTKQDELIQVIGRTEDKAWLKIINSTDLVCWISSEFVSLPVKLDDIPVEGNIPPAPTGMPGTVPAGYTGINYTLDGKNYTTKCGVPLPPAAVCTCNCVTVPGAGGCSCDGDSGGGGGGCDGKGPYHYWHPT